MASPQQLAEVEALMRQLLLPNTEAIRQATERLTEYFKSNAIIVVLCQILLQSPEWPVRQLAAVLLRQRLMRSWRRLAATVKTQLKDAFLQAVVNDPKPLVQHSVAALIAAVAKYELGAGRWPALLELTDRCCQSAVASQREVGMFLLSSIARDSNQVLEPYFDHFVQLLVRALQDTDSTATRVYAFQTIRELIEYASTKERVEQFRQLVPLMMAATQQIIDAGDDENAIQALEVFDELVGQEVPVLARHLGALVEFCMRLATNDNVDESVRVHGLTFVVQVAELKPKELLKLKVLGNIIVALFQVLATTPDDPAERAEHELGPVMDTLVKHLPPDATMPVLLERVHVLSKDANHKVRMAAMMALSCSIEGARDFLRDHIPALAEIVVAGVRDPIASVREAALVALDEMSQYFDEDFFALHALVLPALFEAAKDPRGNVSVYALQSMEAYTEHIGEAIMPYLSGLMELYMHLLATGSNTIRETVICGIGSAAHAAGSRFMPYAAVLDHLFQAMTLTEPELLELRALATDTLGTVANALGKQAFAPHVAATMERALHGVNTIDEPRLRECTYQLFASLAQLYEAEFGPYLPQVVPLLLKSATSREGLVAVDKEGEAVPEFVQALTSTATEDDENWMDPAEGDDDSESEGDMEFTEPTTFMYERVTAVHALGEIFVRCGEPFLPFVTDGVAALTEAASDMHEDVREHTANSLALFLRAVHKIYDGGVHWRDRQTSNATASQQLLDLAKVAAPLLLQLAQDEEKAVATQAFNSIAELLTTIGPVLVNEPDTRNTLGNCIMAVLQKKAPCQMHAAEAEAEAGEDVDEDEAERNAELEGLLIDAAADAMGAFALALGPDFAPYFRVFWPQLAKYYGVAQKPSRPVAERSMAIGTCAEVAAGLKSGVLPFAQDLGNLFLRALQDREAEVRRNAVYGIGCLCESAGAALTSTYPSVLQQLQSLFSDNTEREILDNLGGAVARMIVTAPAAVPLAVVVPALLRILPPREDFDEVRPVVRCLLLLLQLAPAEPALASSYPRILEVLAQILGPPMEQLGADDRAAVIAALRGEAQAGRLASALSDLSADAQTILTAALQ